MKHFGIIFDRSLLSLPLMWDPIPWPSKLNPCPLLWKHRVFTTGPPGKSPPQHILFYCTSLFFFKHIISTQNLTVSYHILLPIWSRVLALTRTIAKPPDWSPCFLALPQSILREQLEESSNTGHLPPLLKIRSGSHLTQSKCQSPESGLPDPTHLVSSHPSDTIYSTCPLAHFTPATLAVLPFHECDRHASDSGLLHTLISLPGRVSPQVAAWIVSLFHSGVVLEVTYQEGLPRPPWSEIAPAHPDTLSSLLCLSYLCGTSHHLLY